MVTVLVRVSLCDTPAFLLSVCDILFSLFAVATNHFNLLPVEPECNAQTEIRQKRT